EEREREAGAVAEAAVQRAGADARRAGHVVHRDVLDAALGDELGGSGEDAGTVARRVGALPRALTGVEDGQRFGHDPDHADCSTGAATSLTRSRTRSCSRAERSGSARAPSSSNAASAMPTGSSDSR